MNGHHYRITHVTEYRYSDDVTVSYGRAHLLPRAHPGQVVGDCAVALDPTADELRTHVDFFGNLSTYYAVRRRHRALRVTATSNVLVTRSAPLPAELDAVAWESARDLLADDVEACAFLLPSPLVRATTAVSEYAAQTFTGGRPLGQALLELTARIYGDFEYVSGATTVKTTLGELLHRRQGVCQDFAHLAVGCLRSVGLPARYVSGYLETVAPPGKPKLQGADASHAWASVRLPASVGGEWLDLDPTNNTLVDRRYVVSAFGRDYSDVPPLKGVILTQANKSTMTVSVDVNRLD
ncbi:MAG: transglutaminase family protein [Actinomycetota bacterium]|nr:transglutaminase family protein [Actinomycetota bacterium]